MRAFRLAFGMHRLEWLLLLGGALLLVGASVVLAWQTRTLRTDELACYARAALEAGSTDACHRFDSTTRFLESGRQVASGLIIVSPFVLGLFIGPPLVARELERRTAEIAWTLSASRTRWLMRRIAVPLAAVLAATFALGGAGEALTRVAPWNEGVDPGFQDYGGRGVLVPLRALAVLGVGIAIGAWIGRQLPALLLTLGATLAMGVALSLAMDFQMAREVEAVPMLSMQDAGITKVYGSGFREDATGEVIGYDEYYARADAVHVDDPPGWTPVVFGVPAQRYGDFVLRESGALGAITVTAFGVAFLVTQQRRPS